VEPLSIVIHASNSPFDHKMSSYLVLKSDKITVSLVLITGYW